MDASYKNYGGRGITIAPEWEDFQVFFHHLKTLLDPNAEDIPEGLTVDRKDNDKGYIPGNIRLVPMAVQALNRRSNRVVTINGVTRCLKEWLNILHIPIQTVMSRVQRGLSYEEALQHPKNAKIKKRKPT